MPKRVLPYLIVAVASAVLTALLYTVSLRGSAAQGDCRTFPETGKTVCGRFLQYWQANGGLAQQGYPISGEFVEVSELNGRSYTVQYFERAVFELHPENQPPYDVLLSQLGTYQFKRKYPNGEPPGGTGTPPTPPFPRETPVPGTAVFRAYDSQGWQPPSVRIAPGETVTWENHDTASAHPIECVQQDSSAACPWTGQIALPAAAPDASGAVVPSTARIAFPRPGIYTFRDAAHTGMVGQVIVGAPQQP
jgi:plastocyanin